MRKALVVGINNYPNVPLSGCVNDANRIAELLRFNGDAERTINFDVMLLTDDQSEIRKPILREAIEALFKDDADVCLFYFSGHGSMSSTGGVIVTPDFKKYDEGISMSDILALANKSPTKDKIIIFDCCHSGNFGTPSNSTMDCALLQKGLTILTACRDNESAIEQEGTGIFTSLLINSLQGEAADILGNISPGDIYADIDQQLGAWNQRPIFKTNVDRFICVRKVTPAISLEKLRRITIYFRTPDAEFRLDPSYEYTDARAVAENVETLKCLQKFESLHMVVPVGEEHMYCAAMNSKSCRLTMRGRQYWRLVRENRV